jgi:hypothetical protein
MSDEWQAWQDWEDFERGLYKPTFTEAQIDDSLALLTDHSKIAEVTA